MNIYFTPTRSNCLLVSRIRKREDFGQCTFIALNKRLSERTLQLEGLRGRSAFIWGDGRQHYESYHFTANSGVKLKINLDYHDDAFLYAGDLACGNHMSKCMQDGLKVLVPQFNVPAEECFTAPYTKLLINSMKHGVEMGKDEIALTVDADVIKNFPACACWTNSHGYMPQDIVYAVNWLGDRIFRLDIGGMKEDIRKFALNGSREMPGERETALFSMDNWLPAYSVERIGNYAFNAYSDILAAFVKIRSE